jgi:hypothetical protein
MKMRIKDKKIGPGEMFDKIKTINRGFTPAAWLPANAITLKEGYTTLSCSAGAARGERHGPLLRFLCF